MKNLVVKINECKYVNMYLDVIKGIEEMMLDNCWSNEIEESLIVKGFERISTSNGEFLIKDECKIVCYDDDVEIYHNNKLVLIVRSTYDIGNGIVIAELIVNDYK